MSKQLQPDMKQSTCDVCSRTMLKGERAEPYLTPSRERRLVCSLCAPRAQREGWIRESVAPETPTRPARQSDRRGFGRLRRRRREGEPEQGLPDAAPEPDLEADSLESVAPEQPQPNAPGRSPRDRRQVRAVPTNAQLKLDRAINVFNESEHARTVAGIARTLGAPGVSALGSASSSAEVLLTVAWELAWYQYTVDLSDRKEPVQLRARGEELEELPEEAREWNAQALVNGTLVLGAPDSAEAAQAPEPPAEA